MFDVKIQIGSQINNSDSIIFDGSLKSFNLDDINNTDQKFIVLYMYILPDYRDHGIKVGMTTCKMGEVFWKAIEDRIKKQKKELALSDEEYNKWGLKREVIYWGICLDAYSEVFKDYKVHELILDELTDKVEKEQEWFRGVHPEKLINLFNEYRNKSFEIYTPRKEQQECVDKLKKYFSKNPDDKKFLLNCKMRFGKCYTTYKFCEEDNINKILILTFVPAVEESWRVDLYHIEKRYKYYTDDNLSQKDFNLEEKNTPYVMFLSLQNYLGKDKDTHDVKAKIAKLKNIAWDLVVLDEYHFGAWNDRTKNTIKKEPQEDINPDLYKGLDTPENVVKKFNIKTEKIICLSGTPFKALERREFTDDNTYTYSYFDEQINKYQSEYSDNYKHFPDMQIYGYNMSNIFGNALSEVYVYNKQEKRSFFSLNEFFKTNEKENKFIYENEVKIWLNEIKGVGIFGNSFPFSPSYLEGRDCLWLLPTISSVHAMAELLNKDEYFSSKYEIINLSDEQAGTGVNALKYLNSGLSKKRNTGKLGSITLTVNKLTLGVTVKEWTNVFVLKDLASPEQYFQSIFRIQTPYKYTGGEYKKKCTVYEFNIDRAASLLLNYASKCTEATNIKNVKLDTSDLIVKYLPIYINGDMSTPISRDVFIQLARFGDSRGKSLSKRISNINLITYGMDDSSIDEMLQDPKCSEVIKRIFAHAKFKVERTSNREGPAYVEIENAKIRLEGLKKGEELGMQDSNLYLDFDEPKDQELFWNKTEEYVNKECENKYSGDEKATYQKGFADGYKKGVNAPIKNTQSGKEDGIKFIPTIKEKFGDDICWDKDNNQRLKNFVNEHLNNIDNIPEQYRRRLSRRWYQDSFIQSIKRKLAKKVEKGENSLEDTKNVLQHIMARLFEFLYISVYRETTFNDVFKNANPNVFLEAVGITKEDFELINKYKIFNETNLNNFIKEFFENESLGKELEEKDMDKYRNSFSWFGFNEIE